MTVVLFETSWEQQMTLTTRHGVQPVVLVKLPPHKYLNPVANSSLKRTMKMQRRLVMPQWILEHINKYFFFK